ncbi:hypothetical protein RA307_02295 [Xanthobacteraceae bacterium Astr-EGSB]|nr:hypothetical protein [Xanthobacteraceae bacterium Astr-EGSB]
MLLAYVTQHGSVASTNSSGDTDMLDLVMLAIAAGFFALALGYVYACEWL